MKRFQRVRMRLACVSDVNMAAAPVGLRWTWSWEQPTKYLQFLQDFIHEVAGVLFVVHGSLDHFSEHLWSGQVVTLCAIIRTELGHIVDMLHVRLCRSPLY